MFSSFQPDKPILMSLRLKYLILLIVFLLTKGAYAQYNSNPINAGTLYNGYTFTDTENNYDKGATVSYTFTLTANSIVNIMAAGMWGSDTYVHLLDANGNELASNDDNGPLCACTDGSIQLAIPTGTYYVVSELSNNVNDGWFATSISATALVGASFNEGIFAGWFGNCSGGTFSDTQNISNSYNLPTNYNGVQTTDIYYYFYVTSTTTIKIATCGSGMGTSLHLMDLSYNVLASNDQAGPLCSDNSASLQLTLGPGAYFLACDGSGIQTGTLITNISTTPIPQAPLAGMTKTNYKNLGALNTVGSLTNYYSPSDCYDPTLPALCCTPLNQIYYRFSLSAQAQVVISGITPWAQLATFSGTNIPISIPLDSYSSSTTVELQPGSYLLTVPAFAFSPITTTITTTSAGLSSSCPTGPGPYSLDCSPLASVPSANQNYIATYIPRQAYIDVNNLSSGAMCTVMQTIQYFDGIGRPLQTIYTKASPTGKDIIQPFAYDQFGRESVKYLSYTSSSGVPGSYRPNALADQNGLYSGSEQSAFYNPPGSSGEQLSTGIARIPTPYAATAFELSPLSRVIEQGAPGDPWQLAGTNNASGVPSGHTIKIEYATNDAPDLVTGNGYWAKQFAVDINPTTGVRSLIDQGAYGPNKLTVTVTKDENWTSGKLGTNEDYKDLDGRIVLKRTFNNNNGTPEILSTYYLYDDFGNLCYVLPPKAEADGITSNTPITQSLLDNLCYQYTYDEKNRQISKKLPGADPEYTIYNILDQVVATQDGKQRINNQWTITKYDKLGRTVIVGLWSSSMTPTDLKTNVDAQTVQWEIKDNNQPFGYTVTNTYPNTVTTMLSVKYYDDYNILNLPSQYQSTLNPLIMTRGLLTANLTNVLATNDMLWEVYYYDNKARVIKSYQQHYLGGVVDSRNYNLISTTYDFTGNVTELKQQQFTIANTNTEPVTIDNMYFYDHFGRKRQTSNLITSNGVYGSNVILSQDNYNELGQEYIKGLYSENNAVNFLDVLTNRYNERGWLRTSTSSTGNFNLDLRYNTPNSGISQQWNGNISEMIYNVTQGASPGLRDFSYTYDALNRLTTATSTGNQLDESITYDKMGNIVTLNRGGAQGANLSYFYSNNNQSNQLSVVKNNGQTVFRTYTYDQNGNAKSDGVNQSIDYNLLNLPKTVTNSSNNNIVATYTYSADGVKLRNSGSDGIWDYVNGVVYHNGAIEFIQVDQGRATINGNTFAYQFDLKDHLGNVRATFYKDPTTRTASVIQESEYYSFGLQYDLLHNSNRYLYNGKEIQTDLTNQYDYGARFYDPIIARWGTRDVLAEKYYTLSPYNYVSNNPTTNLDPDGRDIVFSQSIEKDGTLVIHMTVTGKIIDETGRHYSVDQMNEYAGRLSSAIQKYFGITGPGFRVDVCTDITVGSFENNLTPTDHAFRLRNDGDIPDYNYPGTGLKEPEGVTGIAQLGENLVYISSYVLDKTPAEDGKYANTGLSSTGEPTLERTGSHELGHSAGLTFKNGVNVHPDAGSMPGNLMNQSTSPDAGTKVTRDEIMQMYNNFQHGKINKGQQDVY
jgi:RHS repeat-associated protein